MYLVIIAWMYVAIMMAVAEAVAPNGSLFGAMVTFVLYGLLPAGLLAYILGTPARKAKLRAQDQADLAATVQAASTPADSGAQSPGDPDPERHTAR
ncbi:MAG: hypothetical protein RL357_1823 [Pseudomonadota bacterium]|jgi:hypothetical protein